MSQQEDNPSIIEEEDEKAQDGLQSFAAQILRPQKGGLESLLGSELAIAVMSADPLQKIRHTCECFLMLSEDEQESLAKKEEIPIIKKIYDLAISFAFMPEVKSPFEAPFDKDYQRYLVIPFCFPQSDAKSYLDFLGNIALSPPLSDSIAKEDWKKLREEMKQEPRNEEAYAKYYEWLYRVLTNGVLNIGLCLQIKTLFIRYAMPRVLKLFKSIFTQYISPEVWQSALGSIKAKQGSAGP